MRRRIVSIAVTLALCLTLASYVLPRVYAAEIEVGTGCAHTNLVSAINAAEDGDTIILKSDVILKDETDISLPFIIDKEITIKGDGSQTLTLWQNGLLLNANVTLQGFKLYSMGEINGIFANGYTLTYKDVVTTHEKHHIRLYAGGFHDGSSWRGTPGAHGQVIVEASSSGSSSVGMVLACGLSSGGEATVPWTVPSIITVNGPVSFAPNYVSASALNATPLSGVMGWFPGEYSADNSLKHNPGVYAAGTPVQVVLNRCGTVSVDGRNNASAPNAEVAVYGGQYQTSPALAGITKLTVAVGNVQPSVLENGAALDIGSDTILDLSAVMVGGSYTASAFDGGGTLRVPNDSLLTVTGSVTGSTEFQSTYYQSGDTSGIVTVGHTFIQTPADTDAEAFTFTPFATQPGVELRKNSGGGWYTVIKEASEDDIPITKISLNSNFVEVDVGNPISSDFGVDSVPRTEDDYTLIFAAPIWYGGKEVNEADGTTKDDYFQDNSEYRLELVLYPDPGYCFHRDVELPDGFTVKDTIPVAGCYSITIVKTYTFGTVNEPDKGGDDPGDDPGDNTGSGGSGGGGSGTDVPDTSEPEPDEMPDAENSAEPAEDSSFYIDVPVDYWGADAISYVAKRQYFRGVSETEFAPEQPMTRQMLMTVLARVAGVDTSGDAYAKGMDWAVSAGISDGSAPLSMISRQQLVTMLYRYVGTPETDTLPMMARYTDADQVALYAVPAMAWATQNGIIQGMTETTLAPDAPLTRARAAAILMRFDGLKNQE